MISLKHSQTLKQENPRNWFENSANSVAYFLLKIWQPYQSWTILKRKVSLPLLIKNNYLNVGNGGTETTISWSCFIEDYKTEISYKPWNGSSFCWRIWDRSTYNKLEMSWAGQPSKFVFSIILCRQIWCDIMFSEYNWKPVHKFDLVKEFDNNKKQLNIIKTLYRRTIHSNVYRQNVIQADCQTGKMLYRRMCTEQTCTRRMCTRRMCTWRMCTRQMCT